jgi:predicted phosphoribosyltransferase
MRFHDRRDAGSALSDELERLGFPMPGTTFQVLGVARGGVPVAAVVAGRLGVPLDVVIGRKLGAPGNPEFAIGALAMDGKPVIHGGVVARLRVSQDYLEAEVARQHDEVKRRLQAYRGDKLPLDLEGKTVIVVDDGVATGATLTAVLDWVQDSGAAQVVCAVPVGPPDSVSRLAEVADLVVCPLQPARFRAVGEWYDDFNQTTDETVQALLAASE